MSGYLFGVKQTFISFLYSSVHNFSLGKVIDFLKNHFLSPYFCILKQVQYRFINYKTMARKVKEDTEKSKEKMLKALLENHGNVRAAAHAANVSEQTHYRWCRQDNDYNNAVGSLIDIRLRNAKEEVLNIAMQAIQKGNPTVLNKLLTIFYKDFAGNEEYRYNDFNDCPSEEEEEED